MKNFDLPKYFISFNLHIYNKKNEKTKKEIYFIYKKFRSHFIINSGISFIIIHSIFETKFFITIVEHKKLILFYYINNRSYLYIY